MKVLPKSRSVVLMMLLLAATTIALFWPATRNGFVDLDDGLYITENPMVAGGLEPGAVARAFTTMYGANWHPLTWLSHMADFRMFGLAPGGHHLVSVLWHAAAAVSLFAVLRLLTGAFWPSAFVAALFAFHPLHVESVAWVSERKDVLSAFFWVLTVGLYLSYLQRPGWIRYSAMAAVYALGLMAKPMLVTLPFVLLLLDWWPLGRLTPAAGRGGKGVAARLPALLLEKAPLLALSAASSVVTLVAQRHAAASLSLLPLTARLSGAAVATVTYLGKMFWPAWLGVFYPYPQSAPPLWKWGGAAVLLALVTAVAARQARRRPWLSVGWFCYLGMLVPVIGLVQVGSQFMADRYTYLPLLGLFIMIAWGVPELAGKLGAGAKVLPAAALAVILVLMSLTRIQLGYWKDSETLLRRTVVVTRDNWLAWGNLCSYYYGRGRHLEAVDACSQAAGIRPRDPVIQYKLAAAANALGKHDLAARSAEEALRLRPDYLEAYQALGVAYASLGRDEEALAAFGRALSLKPDTVETWFNMALTLDKKGRYQEAAAAYREAVRLDPANVQARFGLGKTSALTGDGTVAREQQLKLQSLDPALADKLGRFL